MTAEVSKKAAVSEVRVELPMTPTPEARSTTPTRKPRFTEGLGSAECRRLVVVCRVVVSVWFQRV